MKHPFFQNIQTCGTVYTTRYKFGTLPPYAADILCRYARDKLQEVCEIWGVNRGVVECICFLNCKVLTLNEWDIILLGLPNPWKVKALGSFETSDLIYFTTQRHISEDQNTLHKVCGTSCTKSAEHPVKKVCRTLCIKSAEHPVQSLQNILTKSAEHPYKVCRTPCTKSTEHPVQSLQNTLYNVWLNRSGSCQNIARYCDL